jgi:hypothetical protein
VKLERSDVSFPLWRKKVDSSLFEYKGTTIPAWACQMWGIQEQFHASRSSLGADAKVTLSFEGKDYSGTVTIAAKGRKTPAYRLWFGDDLAAAIKDVFLMSYMRDIEARLRKDKKMLVEDEIPFWEFLDIEYDRTKRRFLLAAHYRQKPTFSELFKRLVGSPALHAIDDELTKKPKHRIHKQEWKPRKLLEKEIRADNVLYMLVDTKNRLFYVGQARNLVKRLLGSHPSIPDWDFYRYSALPPVLMPHLESLERMLIRDMASIFQNRKGIQTRALSDYICVNDRIDTR